MPTNQDFYTDNPFENSNGGRGLSHSWLAGAAWPAPIPISDGARIFVAGCGTGGECEGLARSLPSSRIVGMDYASVAIERARLRECDSVEFLLGDLCEGESTKGLGTFDFISCVAVADYVESPGTMLENLAGLLHEDGLLLLAVNTPHHPRARVQAMMRRLGVDPGAHATDENVRDLLALFDTVAGPHPGIGMFGDLRESVVAADLLVPMAHHDPPHIWVQRAAAAGLYLRGDSMVAPVAAALRDSSHGLMSLNYPALAEACHLLLPGVGAWMLFGRRPRPVIDLASPAALDWVPTTDIAVPRAQLPALPLDQETSLTTVMGEQQLVIEMSGAGMRLLAEADGSRTLGQLCESLEIPVADYALEIFRLVHTNLLHLRPGTTP